jgi:hypothetical protein
MGRRPTAKTRGAEPDSQVGSQGTFATSQPQFDSAAWARGNFAAALDLTLQQNRAAAAAHAMIEDSDALLVNGNRKEAENGRRTALAIYGALLAGDPDNMNIEWLRRLAAGSKRFAYDLVESGNLEGALSVYGTCFAACTKLADTDPGNTQQWQSDLAGARKRIVELKKLLGARQNSDSVSPETVQNVPIEGLWLSDELIFEKIFLNEATRLYAEVRKLGYTVESAIETLVRQAKMETTARASPAASAEPRPKGNSPRRRERYVFTQKELRDPKTIDRARDILADAEEFRRTGKEMSEVQRTDKKWAEAFTRRLRKLDVT